MFKPKISVLIFLAMVIVSGKAYCQSLDLDIHVKVVYGKVTSVDPESGAVTLQTGMITKDAFDDPHLDADALWQDLIDNHYVDPEGVVLTRYYKLWGPSDMEVSKIFKYKVRLIYQLFEKALDNNGPMVFYIVPSSKMFSGTHDMASVEIEPRDTVTVQYDSTNSDHDIIRLDDEKPNPDTV